MDAIVRSPDHVYAGRSSSPRGARCRHFTPPQGQAGWTRTTGGAVDGRAGQAAASDRPQRPARRPADHPGAGPRSTASPPTSSTASGRILGRDPTFVELGIFSALWSEHCSLQALAPHPARRFPTEGPQVLQGPGRERRRHPASATAGRSRSRWSRTTTRRAVEPYQGAATGVGGILRDIFTMGARPDRAARLAALRLRSTTPHERYLVDGRRARASATTATASASPPWRATSSSTPAYEGNPPGQRDVRRAAARGRADPGQGAAGPGNPIIAVGARTGRDGIHGAPLRVRGPVRARARRKRPQVQVGDPFTEKLLIEASPRADPRPGTSWPSRTWAPPGSPSARPRWRRAAASASRSTRSWCRCARRA